MGLIHYSLILLLVGQLSVHAMDSLEFIALQRIARQKIPRIIQVPVNRYPSSYSSASMNIPTSIKFPLFVPE